MDSFNIANAEKFCNRPAESMYFNELVLAIAYSSDMHKVNLEVKRSFNDGKLNMVECGALVAIIEKIKGDK